jgi:cytidylate kinase
MLLTVSGPPGSGKSTNAELLAERFDLEYISGGDIFRELAEDRDMSLSQLIAKTDETDEIDRALDRRLRTIAEKWGSSNKAFILESRLAGWLAGNRADLRLWLDAPEEVRKDRISDREETAAEMRVREVSEAGRYQSYYEIDIENREFYDLHLNTARWDKESVFQIVRTAIEQYDTGTDEGAFATAPVEL